MKIEGIKNFSPISYKGENKKTSIPKTPSSEKAIISSLDGTSIIGQAQILTQNNTSKEEKLLQKIFQNKNLKCSLLEENWGNQIYEIKNKSSGKTPTAYANIYYDDKEDIESIYVFNIKEENFSIYNNKGEKTRHFTSDDLKSVSMYKYNSYYFHGPLRYGKKSAKAELLTTMENIFKEKEKLDVAKEDFTVYRASQLPPKEIGEIGEIYQDKSYLSATKNDGIAHHFHELDKAFLKIEIPKDATYLNIDRLFNIKSNRSREKEILLDKNTKYLIEDIDTSTNEISLRMLIEE